MEVQKRVRSRVRNTENRRAKSRTEGMDVVMEVNNWFGEHVKKTSLTIILTGGKYPLVDGIINL